MTIIVLIVLFTFLFLGKSDSSNYQFVYEAFEFGHILLFKTISLEMSRWVAKNGKRTSSSTFRTHGNFSMEVNLYPGKHPGVSTKYFSRNWQGYNELKSDLYLAENDPLEIVVRVHDNGHNNNFNDRYTKKFQIHPELNEITVSLFYNLLELKSYKSYIGIYYKCRD